MRVEKQFVIAIDLPISQNECLAYMHSSSLLLYNLYKFEFDLGMIQSAQFVPGKVSPH